MKLFAALLFIFLIVTQVNAKIGCEKEQIQKCLKDELAKASFIGSASTLGAFVGAKIALWMAGFSALGPVGGSFAAWLQAAYGIGPIFSLLQSLAMGKLTLLLGPAVVAGSAIGFVYWVASCLQWNCFSNSESSKALSTIKKSFMENLTSAFYNGLDYLYFQKENMHFLKEIFEYAANLLLKEYQNYKKQLSLLDQRKCYKQHSTPNDIYEYLMREI